jgi:hypothetical protein
VSRRSRLQAATLLSVRSAASQIRAVNRLLEFCVGMFLVNLRYETTASRSMRSIVMFYPLFDASAW